MPFVRSRAASAWTNCLAVVAALVYSAIPFKAYADVNVTNGSQQSTRMIAAPKSNGNQTTAQQEAQKKADKGSDLSKISGLLSIGTGTYMVIEGMSSQNYSLVAMGAMMIVSGLQGLQGAKELANTANAAGLNVGKMSSSGGLATLNGNDLKAADFKFDPSLLREGKLGEVMDKLEALGVNRDALADAAFSGKPIPIPKTGKTAALTDAKMASILSGAAQTLAADPNAAKEAMEKSGFNAALASYGSLDGGSGLASVGSGSGTGKKIDTGMEDIFANMNSTPEGQNGPAGISGTGEMSPEVQAALDKNGISDKTIFEMVRIQYKKQAPMMFGYDRKPSSDSDPFGVESAPQGI